MVDLTRQLEIIHISDVHFGGQHRFNPPVTPGGDRPSREGYPTLVQKLQEDLAGPDPGCPVILCITGDLTTTCSYEEFEAAEQFVKDVANAPILGRPRGTESIFLVPGNHDVKYDKANIGERWQSWTEFSNRVCGTNMRREDPWACCVLHDRSEEFGAFILCLNSAIFVEKDKPDQERGQLDLKQLDKVNSALRKVQDRLEPTIRIALIHHHPVLIPALAEPGRGYDAVHNSGKLLTILRRYGFHLVLHGHKHNPYIFTDDSRSGFRDSLEQPILIVAGGSAASTELPDSPGRCNCYNRITVKWHPAAKQTRIATTTRGLRVFEEDSTEALPTDWSWSTLNYDDRHFLGGPVHPAICVNYWSEFDPEGMEYAEAARCGEYARTRGNLPVVEVMPSLTPGQAYEARVWIASHNRRPEDVPKEVQWSAGPNFAVVRVKAEDDDRFSTSFSYWRPMLIQATLRFHDGPDEFAYVYARLPDSNQQQQP